MDAELGMIGKIIQDKKNNKTRVRVFNCTTNKIYQKDSSEIQSVTKTTAEDNDKLQVMQQRLVEYHPRKNKRRKIKPKTSLRVAQKDETIKFEKRLATIEHNCEMKINKLIKEVKK